MFLFCNSLSTILAGALGWPGAAWRERTSCIEVSRYQLNCLDSLDVFQSRTRLRRRYSELGGPWITDQQASQYWLDIDSLVDL